MSLLNKLLGSAQNAAARGGTYSRSTSRKPVRGTTRGAASGRRTAMAKRPTTRQPGYGRQPTTAGSGLSGLIGGLLRRR